MQTLTRKTVLGGRYVLEDQIGTGNATSVWRATDSVLDRTIAVRVLHPQAARAGAAERFERAARVAAGLTHPNIVAVYDSGRQGDTPFLVMELLEGEALDRKVARDGPMRAADAVHMASCVLAALTAAQAAGAGHPAISTGQVFVGPGSQVRISAVGAGEHSPANGDRDADAEGDAAIVHAVAEILYFALTGKTPPAAGPASPKAIRARVPRAVDVVVTRALSADPSEQFGSVSSLRSALSRLGLEPGSGVDDSDGGGGNEDASESGSIFRSWMLVPLVMVVVAVAVIVAGFALGRLEIGGPLLVEAKSEPVAPSPARARTTDTVEAKPISIESASAWDPFGDGHENDANTGLAIDSSNATVWKTEDYYSGRLGKPGVGLMLDLGSRQTVSQVRLVTPDPGFRFDIRAGDNPDALAHGTSDGGPFEAAHKVTREDVSPVTGRYVLVWITSIEPLPDGTHGASIADIELAGPSGNG